MVFKFQIKLNILHEIKLSFFQMVTDNLGFYLQVFSLVMIKIIVLYKNFIKFILRFNVKNIFKLDLFHLLPKVDIENMVSKHSF
jgi:hypothetical protein